MVKQSEQADFNTYIQALFAAWDRPCDAAKILAFTLGLKALSIEDVKRGVERAIETGGKFPPSVGELRELSGVVSPQTRAVIAWEHVLHAMKLHHCRRSVDFEDKLINATIRNLGGWASLWEGTSREFNSFTRARFEKTYLAYLENGASAEMQERLIGEHERKNAGLDWETPTHFVECEPAKVERIETKQAPRIAPVIEKCDWPSYRAESKPEF